MNSVQLAPLLLPEPVGYWPLAWGWWALGLLLAVLGMLSYQAYQHWQKRRQDALANLTLTPQQSLKQSTLQQLQQLAPPADQLTTSQWLQQLNQLLKRLAVTRYASLQPQTLTGREWLAFLDNRCPSAGLTRWMILAEGPYKPDCELSLSAQLELYKAVTTWVNKHV